MKYLIFILSGLIALIWPSDDSHSPQKTRLWQKLIPYECHDSIQFALYVKQKKSPFKQAEINQLEFYSEVETLLIDEFNLLDSSKISSSLLYQCALCAPKQLKRAGKRMSFRLSDFFEKPKDVQGRIFLTYNQLGIFDEETSGFECAISRTRVFELR
ncbi:MAG: hypothetical protein MRZ79_16820 [Bacteroidia bacterium]|nr:hypothetical protein [Bacteroidia bacterium]